MVDDRTKDESLGVPEKAAIASEVAENAGMLFLPKLNEAMPIAGKYLPAAGQAVVSSVAAYADYDKGIRGYERALGEDHLKHAAGYNLGEYNPWQESEGKQRTNAWLSVGKGLLLAAVGIPLVVFTPLWVAMLAGIPVALGAGWVYDKVVGRSKAQDPIKLVGAAKELQESGKDVPKELVFAMMIGALEPNDPLRAQVETRLKNATGDHKLHHLLTNPDAMPAVNVIMQDPAVVQRLCDHYGVCHDPKFFERTAALFSQGLIDVRAIEFPRSGDLALSCNQDILLEQQGGYVPGNAPVVAPTLPQAPARSGSVAPQARA